jgi:hypothetical protein
MIAMKIPLNKTITFTASAITISIIEITSIIAMNI